MITNQGEVTVLSEGQDGIRFVSEPYVWSEEDKSRLVAVMIKIFNWRRHVVIDHTWINNLKRDLGLEVERVVKQAIANNANPVHDLHTVRYDVCTDWIVDKAVADLTVVETFNDGEGI